MRNGELVKGKTERLRQNENTKSPKFKIKTPNYFLRFGELLSDFAFKCFGGYE